MRVVHKRRVHMYLSGIRVHEFWLGGWHSDDGSACLYCDPNKKCRLHDVPF